MGQFYLLVFQGNALTDSETKRLGSRLSMTTRRKRSSKIKSIVSSNTLGGTEVKGAEKFSNWKEF